MFRVTAAGTAAMSVDGGGGRNWLDYSAYLVTGTAGVTVTPAANAGGTAATGVSQAVRGI